VRRYYRRVVVSCAARVASLVAALPLAACGFDAPRTDVDAGRDGLGLVPSNGLERRALTDGDGVLDTASTGALVIDADTGAIRRASGETVRAAGEGYDQASKIHFRIVAQTGAPAIGVFSLASLHVAAGTAIRARGRNALALAAAGEIALDGILDLTGGASACLTGDDRVDDAQCAGPGGGLGGPNNAAAPGPGGGGGATGGPQGYAESGGGGGGHLEAGGIGGLGTTNTVRGAPGAIFGSASLEPLTGGGGGGGGGNEPQTGARGAAGGGGGGAVQLVSSASVRIGPGTACGINAGGGGAGRSFDSSGGGGGGAGGGILLEAPDVALGAGCGLAANGGGGSGAHFAAPGANGRLSMIAAPGSVEGSGGQRNAGDGGDGGASTTPQAGENGNDEAGGGGGGLGAVRINTVGGTRLTSAGVICPPATEGAVRLE
jgi:hypothetical protein